MSSSAKQPVKATKTIDLDKYWTVKIIGSDGKEISKSRFKKNPGLMKKLSFNFTSDADTNRIQVYQSDPPKNIDLDVPVSKTSVTNEKGMINSEIEIGDKTINFIPISAKSTQKAEKAIGCVLELPDNEKDEWTVVTGDKTLSKSIINASIAESDARPDPSYPSVLAVQKNRKSNWPNFSGSMRVYADKDTLVFVQNNSGIVKTTIISASDAKKLAGADRALYRVLKIDSNGVATLIDIRELIEKNKKIISVKLKVNNKLSTGQLTIKIANKKHPNNEFISTVVYETGEVDVSIDKGNPNYIFITDGKKNLPVISLNMKGRNKEGQIYLNIDMQSKKATLS